MPSSSRSAADGKSAVRARDSTLLPIGPGFSAAEGKQVRYGFRPEHLSLSASGKGIAAAIDVVEPTVPKPRSI